MTAWPELANAAPPTLLRQLRSIDAHEVLILSYTCDLSFVEDVCLPQARTMRARTTILYDVDQLIAPSAMGLPADYLAAPVACRNGAAFHPKLLVIASPEDAVISIGSGNATASGWHHNAEIWTHLRAAGPTAPQLFHDLADWLQRLPDTIWIEHAGRESLDRVATLLRARPAERHIDEPRLLTSDRAPFLAQIPHPAAPADKLAVASPFFDHKAEALTRLCEKLEPAEITLLLTKDVHCDPSTLLAVLPPGRHELRTPEAHHRYHHGKIIEWRAADKWRTLTGSANCTRSALLESAGGRGNCELGLLSTSPASMVAGTPARDVSELEQLRAEQTANREPRTPEPVTVLGVRLQGGLATAIVLVRRGQRPPYLLVGELRLDHQHADGALHTYTAVLPEQQRAVLGGTTAVSWAGPAGDVTATAAVTDIDAAQSRIQRPSPLEHSPLADVITDPAQLNALYRALEHLATVWPEPVQAPHGGTESRHQTRKSVTDAVGPVLAGLTLGLSLGQRAGGPGPGASSDHDPDGADDTDSEEPAEETRRSDLRLDAARRRQLYRITQRLLDTAADWPLPAVLAATRITLIMAAAGVWPTADVWMPLVHEALVKLWTTETDPSITEEHAALATVGLLALHRGMALHDVSDPALREGFEELRQEYTEWREWLANAPADALSGYSAQLAGAAFGTTFERTDFRTELSWLLTRSALHDAVDELPGAQLDGHGAVRIEGHGKRKAVLATLDALRAFADIEVITTVGVPMHGWWNGRRLLIVTRSGREWRAELWANLPTGIAAYARGDTAIRRPDRTWPVTTPQDALTGSS